MACSKVEESATRVSVHLVRGQVEAARAVDLSKVALGPLTTPEGELYAGGEPSGTETTPEWWGAFFGPEMLGNTPDCRRYPAVAILTRVGGALFAVTVGTGKDLLVPDSLSRRFGLKILLSLADANHHSSELMAAHVQRLATLAERPVRELKPWVISNNEIKVGTDQVRQVTALPPDEFKELFGSNIQGDAGLTFTTSSDWKSLKGMIQRLHEAHEDLFRADPDCNGTISRNTLMEVVIRASAYPPSVFSIRDVAPPRCKDILLPLLQQVAAAQESGPGQLYHPVADKLRSTVMLTVAGQENQRKRAFKERVRRSLRILENAGLLNRRTVGQYTITAMGKEFTDDGTVFDQRLLNELQLKKSREKRSRQDTGRLNEMQ